MMVSSGSVVTVNAKNIVLTSNDDDDIDFDEGFQGNIQYALVIKNPTKEAPSGSNDPRGIEANSSDADFVEETNAVLANVTVIGSQVSDGEPGMRLRGSLTTSIYNSVVTDFDEGCYSYRRLKYRWRRGSGQFL